MTDITREAVTQFAELMRAAINCTTDVNDAARYRHAAELSTALRLALDEAERERDNALHDYGNANDEAKSAEAERDAAIARAEAVEKIMPLVHCVTTAHEAWVSGAHEGTIEERDAILAERKFALFHATAVLRAALAKEGGDHG